MKVVPQSNLLRMEINVCLHLVLLKTRVIQMILKRRWAISTFLNLIWVGPLEIAKWVMSNQVKITLKIKTLRIYLTIKIQISTINQLKQIKEKLNIHILKMKKSDQTKINSNSLLVCWMKCQKNQVIWTNLSLLR